MIVNTASAHHNPAAMQKTPSRSAAFTLIELLVVIAIIAILIGLLFPAFRAVQNQAKQTQAKNDLTQIVNAVNAFYTDYGKYPVAVDDTPIADNSDLFYTLRAIANGTANAGNAANPRKIVFISPPDVKNPSQPRAGIGTDGKYYDPWGTTYKIAIDGNYDNSLANPYGDPGTGGAGSNPIPQGVIAWSLGSDLLLGTNGNGIYRNPTTGAQSDDVISWQ
jgi:prepilin-type N-terminal cleavage/methylation domain-containing protein